MYANYQGGGSSGIRTSYQDEYGNNFDYDAAVAKDDWKNHHGSSNQHGDEENEIGSGSGGRAEGGFNFGSVEERMFGQYNVQMGGGVGIMQPPVKMMMTGMTSPMAGSGLMSQKQLFANIEINIWIPRDPYLLNLDFKLQDLVEDQIEKLEKVQYHVSYISKSLNYLEFSVRS